MIFRWAAAILDAWSAAPPSARARLARPFRFRDLWRALPGDLLGMVVMRGCGIPAPTREVKSGDMTAVLIEDPRVERWFRAHMIPVRAQTLGHFVFAPGPVPPDILAHEFEHIRQWERFGPFYLTLYFGASAAALLRGRRAYWDNDFEIAARDRADRETAALRDAGPD
ncbi:MAG: hypothetical protein ACHQ01_00770 [Candidatus Limnocylindrales bacterium]